MVFYGCFDIAGNSRVRFQEAMQIKANAKSAVYATMHAL